MEKLANNKAKLFVSGLFAALLLATGLFVALQNSVKAALPTNGGDTFVAVDVRATAWSSAVIATNDQSCGTRFAKDISPEDVGTAIFYSNGSAKAGYVTQPSGSGVVDCKNGDNWFSNGLDLWGWKGNYGGDKSNPGFLIDLGYVYSDPAENGDGGYGAPSQGGLSVRQPATSSQIKSTIEKEWGHSVSNPQQDVKYYVLYTDFTKGCGATPFKATSDSSVTPNDKIGDTTYIIKDVDPATGKVREMIYKGSSGKGTNVTIGYGVLGSGYEKTCKDLAAALNDQALVNAFSQYWVAALAGKHNPLEGTSVLNGTDGQGAGSADQSQTCESIISEMGWIICPVGRAADSASSKIQSVLVSLLKINEDPKAYVGIKAGWSEMRMISSALIVLVAVVMIASQIFSFDFMSAYTVKKVLPRLFIAAILIQLSWFIFTTAISFVNAVGDGIATVLYAPFPQLANAASQGNTLGLIMATFVKNAGWGTFVAGNLLMIGGGLAGFAAIGGWAGLGLAAIGVLLAVLVAFVTLVLRKVFILALLIVAPLALVAWILPGTQKWWDKWWDMFTRLLLMYPLIIGLVIVGQIGAWLAAQGGSAVSPASMHHLFLGDVGSASSNIIVFFVILIAYFGPFFFIPSMFKFGGTLLAKASSFAQNGANTLKKARPIRNLEKARDNNKAGRDYNAKLKGINRAAGNTTLGRMPGVGRAVKGYGRLQAGTGGATGAYARQLRGNEREAAIKNAKTQISEDIKELGLTDYDDQLDYRVALAKGDKSYTDRTGKTHTIRSYGASGQQAATMDLVDSGKADRIREVRSSLAAQGIEGEKIWSDAMESHAGGAVKVAADTVGKPYESLRASEMATQDPGSLRNMAAEYEAAVHDALTNPDVAQAAQSAAKAEALEKITAELADNETLYSSVNQEGKDYIEYVKSKGAAGKSAASSGQDYKGHKATRKVKGDPTGRVEQDPDFSGVSTMPEAKRNASNWHDNPSGPKRF